MNNRSKLILAGLALLSLSINGQNVRNATWLFSSDSEIGLGSEGSKLSFGDGTLDTTSFVMEDMIFTASTVISDVNGDLVAYSNGCRVYGNDHQTLTNGDSLSFGGWYVDSNCPFWGNVARNDNLLLPVTDSLFYLLHKRYKLVENPLLSLFGYQLLSTVIKLSDKNVEIVSKNNIELDNQEFGVGYVHATQTPNSDGWWVSQVDESGEYIYSLLLDENGIKIVDKFNFDGDLQSASGQGCFSPDGSIFAGYARVGKLNIFDFDTKTGKYSNHRNLFIPDTFGSRGFCISPNSRFGYIATLTQMWQADLLLDNLEDGLVLIDTFDGFGDPLPTRFSYGQLGPDCKLYFASANSSKYLHVIHEPNLKGKACQFRQHDLELPHYNAPHSIPNLPFYRNDEISDCRGLVALEEINNPLSNFNLFPNPSGGVINVNWDFTPETFLVELYDINGVLLFSYSNQSLIDLSHLSNGMYFLIIRIADDMVTKRVIKTSH